MFVSKHGKKTNVRIILLHQKSYSILQIAKKFGGKIKFLPKKTGERYASALTKMHLSNKVINKFGKV